MTDFEMVLQECLRDLEQGAASVDECLSRHPEQARELEPILFANLQLERAGEARLSDEFKARVRGKLISELHAHPRKPARPGSIFMRLAAGFTVILLALLATGTVYAQNTLPGEALYAWKLASEDAWRAVSPDPVETDLVIAERRVDELAAVSDDPELRAQTLEEYLATVDRLRSQAGTEDQLRIVPTLDSQREKLKKLGILLSQSGSTTVPFEPSAEPTLVPAATPSPTLEPGMPQVDPTGVPEVLPTVDVLPEIIPTVEIPPELLPTFEIPPPIR